MKDDFLDSDVIAEEQTGKFKTGTVIIWAALLIFSILMKIQHWPGNAIMILLTSAGLSAYCFIGYLFPKERNLINSSLSILGVIWAIIIAYGALFKDGRLYTLAGLGVYCAFLAALIGIYYWRFSDRGKSLNS